MRSVLQDSSNVARTLVVKALTSKQRVSVLLFQLIKVGQHGYKMTHGIYFENKSIHLVL